MNQTDDFLKETADRQVLTTRKINFPVAKVYKAWADPLQLVEWWGPKDFTNTFHIYDLQPGGRWSYTMHGPDFIGHFENEAFFLEIVPLKKIVWDRSSRPHFRTYVEFEDIGDATKINWIMAFDTVEEYNKLIKFVPEKNEENLDRLEDFLAKI